MAGVIGLMDNVKVEAALSVICLRGGSKAEVFTNMLVTFKKIGNHKECPTFIFSGHKIRF